MTSWRENILREFTPGLSDLTMVVDPDALLLEDGIREEIVKQGFEIITYDDPIEFRFQYESKFRRLWDHGGKPATPLVIRTEEDNFDLIPYDIASSARRLSFNMWKLFPGLSYPIISQLNRNDLDKIHTAIQKYKPGKLGDNATKDFVLRHVYHVFHETIGDSAGLLHMLIRYHYTGIQIPYIFIDRLKQLLKTESLFEEWPIDVLLLDKESFLGFLQERWSIFLDYYAMDDNQLFNPDQYSLEYPGPALLPFDDHEVRIYLDNLFIEDLLQPIPHASGNQFKDNWMRIGIELDPSQDMIQRFRNLFENIQSELPDADTSYVEWFKFSYRWAKLIILYEEIRNNVDSGDTQKYRSLRDEIDIIFQTWLLNKYSGLFNLPPKPPLLMHHIPRYLNQKLKDAKHEKIAFILVDGLSIDQWLILKSNINPKRTNYKFIEQGIFALIPTITPISRQASFAGRTPQYFSKNTNNNAKESQWWTQFWVDNGYMVQNIGFLNMPDDIKIPNIEQMLSNPKLKIAGFILGKVDSIMHGIKLGMKAMHNQVKQWAEDGKLKEFLDILLDQNFTIYLSSDHGNVETEGIGRINEGVISDKPGQRVRVYSDEILKKQIKEKFPQSIEWPQIGLPDQYLPLIASGRTAFIQKGKKIVCHGGICLEEVIVPFISIERSTR